ncbi:unnamed protein product [Pedinophyceae sp. YPF-701]|nr:unnamed protein product [Pedinophyceae sp. YPF-701]
MRPWGAAVLAGLLAGLLAGPSAAHDVALDEGLSQIFVCAQVAVLVKKTPEDYPNGRVVLTSADDAVMDAFSLEQDDGMLSIKATRFETRNPVELTVYVPPLPSLVVFKAGPGAVVLAPGLSFEEELTVAAESGASVYVKDVSTPSLILRDTGATDLFVSGEIGDVDVDARGSSSIALDGVRGAVTIDLIGSHELTVAGAGDSMSITGTLVGNGVVRYEGGACSVAPPARAPDLTALFANPFVPVATKDRLRRQFSQPPFASPCVESAVEVAREAPQWTCGVSPETVVRCTAVDGEDAGGRRRRRGLFQTVADVTNVGTGTVVSEGSAVATGPGVGGDANLPAAAEEALRSAGIDPSATGAGEPAQDAAEPDEGSDPADASSSDSESDSESDAESADSVDGDDGDASAASFATASVLVEGTCDFEGDLTMPLEDGGAQDAEDDAP